MLFLLTYLLIYQFLIYLFADLFRIDSISSSFFLQFLRVFIEHHCVGKALFATFYQHFTNKVKIDKLPLDVSGSMKLKSRFSAQASPNSNCVSHLGFSLLG